MGGSLVKKSAALQVDIQSCLSINYGWRAQPGLLLLLLLPNRSLRWHPVPRAMLYGWGPLQPNLLSCRRVSECIGHLDIDLAYDVEHHVGLGAINIWHHVENGLDSLTVYFFCNTRLNGVDHAVRGALVARG